MLHCCSSLQHCYNASQLLASKPYASEFELTNQPHRPLAKQAVVIISSTIKHSVYHSFASRLRVAMTLPHTGYMRYTFTIIALHSLQKTDIKNRPLIAQGAVFKIRLQLLYYSFGPALRMASDTSNFLKFSMNLPASSLAAAS